MGTDWHFWLPIGLTLCLGMASLYMQQKNNVLVQESMVAAAKKKPPPKISWLRQYWPVILMTLFTCISWIPYLHRSSYDNAPRTAFLDFGAPHVDSIDDPAAFSRIVTDGDIFMDDSGDFRLAGAVYVHASPVDQYDEPLLMKSSLYEIRPRTAIEIVMPWSPEYRQDLHRGARMTYFALLLVPKTVEMNQFDTLNQAKRYGVRVYEIKNMRQ
jgi:hypothetical protein